VRPILRQALDDARELQGEDSHLYFKALSRLCNSYIRDLTNPEFAQLFEEFKRRIESPNVQRERSKVDLLLDNAFIAQIDGVLGRPHEAILRLNRIIPQLEHALSPSDRRVFLRKGSLTRFQRIVGDVEGALQTSDGMYELAKKYSSVDPASKFAAIVSRASAQHVLGLTENAEQSAIELMQLLQSSPAIGAGLAPTAWMIRASLHLREGRAEAALQTLDEMETNFRDRVPPDVAAVVNGLRVMAAVSQNAFSNARDNASRLSAGDKSTPAAHRNFAFRQLMMALTSGDRQTLDSAANELSYFENEYPVFFVESSLVYAYGLERLGDREEAARVRERATVGWTKLTKRPLPRMKIPTIVG
jgi:hypothetical protein